MTILVVQCRLSSSRLSEKALLPLAGKPLLGWTLSAMKKVPADRYFLATDEESQERLFSVALENGFECFSGPRDDVLKRFCLLIEQTGADTVIRATGDNPFLYYESVAALSAEFPLQNCDYFTWTGLPHGCGAEIFSGKKLLEAAALTDAPYDREHVGPALYAHPETFTAVKKNAPPEWNFPHYRTTVDTPADYVRAKRIARAVLKKRAAQSPQAAKASLAPFTAAETNAACVLVQNAVLLVPSVQKGRGTGHLRRCVSLADALCADLYIPKTANLPGIEELVSPLDDFQLRTDLPQKDEYALIAADAFALEKPLAARLCALAPLVSIDDGASETGYCDYLLDIIPACDYKRKPNLVKSSFIPLPKNRREPPRKIEKVLIAIGGEDPAGLTMLSAAVFNTLGFSVTAVVPDPKSAETISGIHFVKPIDNLMEKLYAYDLIVTHYGFTAFEAVAAGCAVLLAGTSALHVKLSKFAGFVVLTPENITPNNVARLTKKAARLFPRSKALDAVRTDNQRLYEFIRKLADGRRICCPVCRKDYGRKKLARISDTTSAFNEIAEFFLPPDAIVARNATRTYRRCQHCGMLYLAWSCDEEKQYGESYFFEEYKSQYGKTYLEDFSSIKALGVRRGALIDALFWKRTFKKDRRATVPSVLDIGCAYGPFLSAAADAGWHACGSDISPEAVDYVKNTLGFSAACARFPVLDAEKEFGINQFDALTMWFVIEHFQDVDAALKTASCLVKKGGVFAFSTPSASGVSGRFRRTKFFQNSPADHYSLWQPQKTPAILARYGFKVKKIVSTGQHPERFPFIKKNRLKSDSILYKLLSALSKFFKLGDTFEVYSVKIGTKNDVKEK